MESGLRLAGQDSAGRRAFFRLETPEARLLRARLGAQTGYHQQEAGLKALHRALWGDVPPIVEVARGPDGRTSFAGGALSVPAAYTGFRGQERALYRAAMAHIGAHLAFGQGRFDPTALKPLHIAVISLIEDARVEALAMARLPGLARLWRPFHDAPPDPAATAPSLFAQLARALIDPAFTPGAAWAAKGRMLFAARGDRLHDAMISREIGLRLAHDLGQARVQFDARNHLVQPAYRDDNLGLWELSTPPEQAATDLTAGQAAAAEDRPEPVQRADAQGALGPEIACLPEYDYAARITRPDWVTARSYAPAEGDPRF